MASRAVIYRHVAASRIRAQAQYRLSFALQVIGSFGISFLDFIAVLVIFEHLPSLGGWSLAEIAFLYGSSYMTFKAADVIMTSMDRIPLLIRAGTFDQILTRPLGSLGQVLTSDIDIRHVGGILQGAVIFAFGIARVDITWTPARVAVLAAMLVSGVMIFCAIYVITNAIAFWIMDAREVANSFTYGGQFLTQFPLHIFGVWFRRLVAYVIPLAFVNYFPSLYLLGKPDPIGAPTWLRFVSPLVAVAAVIVARTVWGAGIRHYRSTGS